MRCFILASGRETHDPSGKYLSHLLLPSLPIRPAFPLPQASSSSFSHCHCHTFKEEVLSASSEVSCSQSRRWDPLMMIHIPFFIWGISFSICRERCLTEPGIPRGAEMLALIPPSPPFWELLHSSSGGSQSPGDGLLGQVPDLSTRPRWAFPLPRASDHQARTSPLPRATKGHSG